VVPGACRSLIPGDACRRLFPGDACCRLVPGDAGCRLVPGACRSLIPGNRPDATQRSPASGCSMAGVVGGRL
jgi:hypothetical protein